MRGLPDLRAQGTGFAFHVIALGPVHRGIGVAVIVHLERERHHLVARDGVVRGAHVLHQHIRAFEFAHAAGRPDAGQACRGASRAGKRAAARDTEAIDQLAFAFTACIQRIVARSSIVVVAG